MGMPLKLFLTFAFIGATNFGGGIAMLPMFRREVVEKRDWLTEDEIADVFSIAQCLPGIIATNIAVLVGYKQAGVRGAISAAIGVIAPSVIFILLVASLIFRFSDIPVVAHAFAGLRVCVSVLILTAVVKLRKQASADKLSMVIFAVIFLAVMLTNLPIAILVVAAGLIGISISAVRKRSAK
jgi:chromate transporter